MNVEDRFDYRNCTMYKRVDHPRVNLSLCEAECNIRKDLLQSTHQTSGLCVAASELVSRLQTSDGDTVNVNFPLSTSLSVSKGERKLAV